MSQTGGSRTAIKVGYAEGECSKCGKTLKRRRPASIAVCDCYKFCPLCGKEMEPYAPDMDPTTYDSVDGIGDTGEPMRVLYWCPGCRYYSSQQPMEVELS